MQNTRKAPVLLSYYMWFHIDWKLFFFNSTACKMLSDGGLVSNCTMDCCQGELCNTGGSTSKPSTDGEGSTKKGIQSTASVVQSTTSKPSGAVLGPAVSLASILSAVVLPKIVGFN